MNLTVDGSCATVHRPPSTLTPCPRASRGCPRPPGRGARRAPPAAPRGCRRRVRAHRGGMLVRAPLVEAEQDGSIRIEHLTKVVMARWRLGLAEERLVPYSLLAQHV